MARTDAIVLGAGVVGVSAALHLAKRGLSVALVDRRAPGEETSYGNAGIIEGNTYFPYPLPNKSASLLKIAFKQAPEANYHLDLSCRRWRLAVRLLAPSSGEAMLEFAAEDAPAIRPAMAEHER